MITVLILIHLQRQMLHLKLILEDQISQTSVTKAQSKTLLLQSLQVVEIAVDSVQFVTPQQVMKHQSIPLVLLKPIIKNAITINTVALKFVKEKVPLDN